MALQKYNIYFNQKYKNYLQINNFSQTEFDYSVLLGLSSLRSFLYISVRSFLYNQLKVPKISLLDKEIPSVFPVSSKTQIQAHYFLHKVIDKFLDTHQVLSKRNKHQIKVFSLFQNQDRIKGIRKYLDQICFPYKGLSRDSGS